MIRSKKLFILSACVVAVILAIGTLFGVVQASVCNNSLANAYDESARSRIYSEQVTESETNEFANQEVENNARSDTKTSSRSIVIANDAEISVLGEARVKVDPDRACVYMSIENVDMNPDVSKKLTLDMYAQALEKLSEFGVAKSDVDMSYFRTYPSYDYSSVKTLTGHYAVLNFNYKLNDIAKVNESIDALFDLGITTVSHVNYEVTEMSDDYNAILQEALINAESKAKLLLNKDEIELVDFVEENSYNCMTIYRNYAASSVNADLSSQIELTARVKATFK